MPPKPARRQPLGPSCSAIFDDDGSRCGVRPAEGNPPLCDDCAAELEGDALDKMNDLSDKALTLFDKFSGMWNRAAAALRNPGPVGQPRRAPPPRQDAGPPPPRPGPGPPPPRPGPRPTPPPPRNAGSMTLTQALYEFGWGPEHVYTTKDVKARRKALAVFFHGDKNGGFDGRMKAVNAACEILLKHARPAK